MRAGALPRIPLFGARTFLYAANLGSTRSGCPADSLCNFTSAGLLYKGVALKEVPHA